jgi:hypothetical protein
MRPFSVYNAFTPSVVLEKSFLDLNVSGMLNRIFRMLIFDGASSVKTQSRLIRRRFG